MLATILHALTTLAGARAPARRPLTSIPLDVLHAILDSVSDDTRALAALSRTSTALHTAAAPRLFARIELSSYTALYAFVETLEARPALGLLVRSFEESARTPFLFLETQGSSPPPHLLTRLLSLTPRLKVLRIASPVDIDTPELRSALAGLKCLEELELGDAKRGTMALLSSVRPLRTLRVNCWPSALIARFNCPKGTDFAASLAAYLDRAKDTLTTLELDAAVLDLLPADVRLPHLSTFIVHGRSSKTVEWGCAPTLCTEPCAWCGPRDTVSRTKATRPFSLVRWLASHLVAVPF